MIMLYVTDARICASFGDGHDQRQQVAGNALLAGLEERNRTEQEVLLGGVEAGPVRHLAREVDRLGVPRAQALGFLEEPHWNRIPVEPAVGDGRVTGPLRRGAQGDSSVCRTQNSQRVGEPVKSSCAMPNAHTGSTRKHEFSAGSSTSIE